MLHHILAQVSIHLNQKQHDRPGSAFTLAFCIFQHSVSFCLVSLFRGFFAFHCFTTNFFSGIMLSTISQQHPLCFMFSLVLGSRTDRSRVILSRPHGTAERCGTWQFREVFFRGARELRTVIRSYLGIFISLQCRAPTHDCICGFLSSQ